MMMKRSGSGFWRKTTAGFAVLSLLLCGFSGGCKLATAAQNGSSKTAREGARGIS
ncbi:MAG: hypothetical protein LBP35_07085 [Candidatus Ancillula trichonymphae]|nr:hypothetical protein [Candidatus Ancillula trichonymphae]